MSEMRALWVHGLSPGPDCEKLARTAAEVAAEEGITLVMPQLNVIRDGHRITAPFDDQAEKIARTGIGTFDMVIGHSQSVITLSCLPDGFVNPETKFVFLAPAVTSPAPRLEKYSIPATAAENLAAQEAGLHGAQGVLELPGKRRLVQSVRYWQDIAGGTIDTAGTYHPEIGRELLNPLPLALGLFAVLPHVRILWATKDRRLGDLTQVYTSIKQAAPHVQVEQHPATHMFLGHERKVAQAALLSTKLDLTRKLAA